MGRAGSGEDRGVGGQRRERTSLADSCFCFSIISRRRICSFLYSCIVGGGPAGGAAGPGVFLFSEAIVASSRVCWVVCSTGMAGLGAIGPCVEGLAGDGEPVV